MKDPAFLFYSQDFYAGTRLMLPDERACYIDLLIYQHQNGYIPNDLDRILMFCSGINKATLKATLKAKFKQSENGWYNERLRNVISERKEFKEKLSVSGTIGQFWKKTKGIVSAKEYKILRKYFESFSKDELVKKITEIDLKNKGSLKGWLKALLKHIENENENENEINNNKNIHLKFAHLKITKDNHNKLVADFGKDQVHNIYLKIKNYRQNTKYKDLYLTALNWLKRDKETKNKNYATQKDQSTDWSDIKKS